MRPTAATAKPRPTGPLTYVRRAWYRSGCKAALLRFDALAEQRARQTDAGAAEPLAP
jgi:hypothetical protein